MKNLKLLQLQLAFFFEEIENRPDKLASKMEEVSGNIFDQMPIMLPIPPNAPPEVPSVIMNSENGTYTCNIAKSRIDFIFNMDNTNDEDISLQFEKFISILRPYSSIVFGYKSIVRFGLIAQYFYKTNNPVQDIQSKYLKPFLSDLEEINIRYNKKTHCNDLTLNNIVDLGKATFEQNQNTQDGIVIQRDINNIPDASILQIEDVFLAIKAMLPSLGVVGISEILK